MLIKILKPINKFLPENLRLFLLPYYRNFFPSLRNIMFFPLLECNYSCTYCLWKKFTPPELKSTCHPYTDWIRIFGEMPPLTVIITGGEPLIYPDIVPLIDNFPKKHLISSLVTNLSVNIDKLLVLRKKEFRIMASFHPSMTTKEAFLENLLTLRKNGFPSVTVNFVACPSYLKEIPRLKEYFEGSNRFYFRVDTYKDPYYNYSAEELGLIREYKMRGIIAKDRTESYDFSDSSLKLCKGGTRYIIIVQNGNIYSCVEGFYYTELDPYKDKCSRQDVFYLGNVFKVSHGFINGEKKCHSPCAELCDIELAGVRLCAK